MTYEQQLFEADEMQRTNAVAQEERVREVAEQVVASNGPTIVQTTGHFRLFDFGSGVPSTLSFNTVVIDLYPALKHSPEGKLIAEIMIRDAFDLAKMQVDY